MGRVIAALLPPCRTVSCQFNGMKGVPPPKITCSGKVDWLPSEVTRRLFDSLSGSPWTRREIKPKHSIRKVRLACKETKGHLKGPWKTQPLPLGRLIKQLYMFIDQQSPPVTDRNTLKNMLPIAESTVGQRNSPVEGGELSSHPAPRLGQAPTHGRRFIFAM